MGLSLRLSTLLECIQPHHVVVDIGSDHGLLPRALLQRSTHPKVYATEWKDGPFRTLQQALKDLPVHLYQANGLDHLPNDVNAIVLSGLGGMTIKDILSKIPFIDFQGTLILSPQSDVPLVRQFISQIHFQIKYEAIIFEKKYYWIMVAEPGEQSLSSLETEYGPYLIRHRSVAFLQYLRDQIKKLTILIAKPKLKLTKKKQLEKTLKEMQSLC